MKLKFVIASMVWLSACFHCLAQAASDPSAADGSKPEPVKAEESAAQPAAENPANPASPTAPAAPSATPEAKPEETAAPTAPADAAPSTAAAGSPAPAENRGPLTLDHDLPAAVQFLARMANLNIHFDPSITYTNSIGADGKPGYPHVTLRWEDVTAEDALQEVLDINGLTLVKNPKTNVSRVTRRPNIAPMITSIVQLQYTNPTNMVDLIKATFTEPRSKVTADPRTKQLILVTTERDFETLTNLLVRLDVPTKQVLIEARLIETSKNPKSVKGIDWTGTLEKQQVTFGNGITKGTTTTSDGQASTTTLPSGRTITDSSGTASQTTLSTLLGSGGISANTARGMNPATAFLNADGVSAVLSFLNTDNDTEVVATPRAVTADNEMASLSITHAYPIFQVTPGSANSPAGAQVTYTNVGTLLKVTPRISAREHIALRVIPEVSNIESKDVQIVNGTRNEANVYAIRRIEANVVIPSGNTLVMGGLISDSKSQAHTKVPILGDLPGLGLAFRKDTKSRSKSNLLIFVTPTIVKEEDFQPTPSNFLQTKAADSTDMQESAWDSGKPKQWFKSKKDEPQQ
jgi:type II secretory pathway component GspD/PulD (secretin)